MSQPFDDLDEEMQVALEVSKDDSHDADSIKALRLSLREKREREKEAPKKEATRKGKRKERNWRGATPARYRRYPLVCARPAYPTSPRRKGST